MRAHRQRQGAYWGARIVRAGRSSVGRHRLIRAAGLAVTLVLSGATALAVLPAVAAAEECPNAAFRTGPSTHLPDCRADELVSPSYKAGGGFAGNPVVAVNPSGSSLMFLMSGAIPGTEGFPNVEGFLAAVIYTTRRTASGWVTVPDAVPASKYTSYLHNGLSSNGGLGGESPAGQATVWMDREVSQPANEIDFYKIEPDGLVADIGPALPPTAPSEPAQELGGNAGLAPVGLSSDASHYFFSIGDEYVNNRMYWPFDNTISGAPSLYEYTGTGNTTPLLVGVDNSGKLISECGTVLGSPESHNNPVSEDGNTVFFTARPVGAGVETPVGGVSCTSSGPPVEELFARIDNGLPGAHTVAISEPSKEDCEACDTEAKVLANATFDGASADGSKVFFTTTQPLLGGDTSTNIYEYDFEAPAGKRVIRVSAGDSTVSNPAAEVVQLTAHSPMSSEDGSHVYFVANGLLTRTPNAEGETAEQGAYNLYVFELDARFPTGHIAFVARLTFEDGMKSSGHEWDPDLTPDGRFFVFDSERDLTPDDTSTARQVFEYDAQSGSLVRISIGQEGFNHDGNVRAVYGLPEELNGASIVSPAVGYSERQYVPTSYWSDLTVSVDGSYVFFESPVGLTPQALNEKVIGETPESEPSSGIRLPGEPIYANNVYEYHDGRVSLISDGQDLAYAGPESTVKLSGTDASGGDVFFATADQLVGQDTNTAVDVYDARIDGGFPAPAQPTPCAGEECQGALSAAPTLLSPSSELQAGGNPPLAGEPAAKATQKQAKRQKSKKKKKSNASRGRAKRRGGKASKATAVGRANRRGGRS
jgi:hypothetical protein